MRYLFLLLSLFFFEANAQRLYSPGGDHYSMSQREVFDTAQVHVFYKLKFRKDSTKVDDYTESQAVLMVSGKYVSFCDYNRLAFDSINDIMASSKKQARYEKNRSYWQDAISAWKYYTVTISDIAEKRTTVQLYDILRSYEYTFDTPEIKWQLAGGDTIVNGVSCKKASCSYAGRDYIAWYAESISLPYGPYIFGGLPGLIMELHDTHGNWIFTNNGVQKPEKYPQMYLYKKKYITDIISTTREKALSAYKNDIENFKNLSLDIFKVRTLVNGKWVQAEANYPQSPSNMLELEW